MIKQKHSNWYSLQDPRALPNERWGKTEKRRKNGNVLLNVSNDHKHINHRELRLLLRKWIRLCFEGEGWREHMRDECRDEGTEEARKWRETRRLQQPCSAGCPLVLYHNSLTVTHIQAQYFFNDQSLIYKPYRHATIEPYMFSWHCRTHLRFKSSHPDEQFNLNQLESSKSIVISWLKKKINGVNDQFDFVSIHMRKQGHI